MTKWEQFLTGFALGFAVAILLAIGLRFATVPRHERARVEYIPPQTLKILPSRTMKE